MKPSEQIIAIAEAIGYEPKHIAKKSSIKTWQRGGATCVLPDFPADLNAAVEAARHLCNEVWDSDKVEEFGKWMVDLHPHVNLLHPSEGHRVDYYDVARLMTESPASAYCEAILRTLALWQD
jgi:hypothetical protein